MKTAERKCFFFDRDGIVNQAPGPGYVERWEDFHILPEFVTVLSKVIEAGYSAAIVTNQRCVARGIITEAALQDMHKRLIDILRQEHGLDLLDIYYCPHERDTCDCRKPQPGMLIRAAEDHCIDLSKSWFIGDQQTDVETGKRAGCRTIYVTDDPLRDDADITVSDMKELVSIIDTVLASQS
jgi:D-glycero-D-manno-heptose 1,7-bisphosphate phosphatase